MTKELIVSVQSIIPTKGTNAGKPMTLVNGKHWCKQAPTERDTHICLEPVEIDGKNYINVQGFSADIRMTITEKIELVTKQDAGYAMAVASLLK